MGSASLEVTLVSGRRPDLLARTLASFSERLFRHFDLRALYANLDPIFGTEADHRACLDLIRTQMPDATIFEPREPGFAVAVQRVWGETQGELVLHLEDDWILHEDVTPADVLPALGAPTAALALQCRELGWNGRDPFNRRRRKVRFLGIPLGRREFQVFGTSPRFLTGGFARRCAELMDTHLDPEKQMRPPGNPALIDHLQGFRCRILPPRTGPFLISDIGRAWAEAHGIRKTVRVGACHWSGA